MEENTFKNPLKTEGCSLDEIARLGAQEMLKLFLESEIQSFIEFHKGKKLENGQSTIIRNGYHKERPLTVGSGTVQVKVPRSRDKSHQGISFTSAIVPRYMRRSLKIDEAIPLLYLLGISTNNMSDALEKLLGPDVTGLSSTNISRLKSSWSQEYDRWKRQYLSGKDYCYLWADGIHFNIRHDDSRLCVLVLVGALSNGHKELIAVESGYRESSESWSMLLRDIRDRGMLPAKLLIGDGALVPYQYISCIFWQKINNSMTE
jgi:transposase-like protein